MSNLKGKTVLVTGISGFVGSYLAKYLVDQRAEVYGLVVRRADGSIPKWGSVLKEKIGQ